MGGELGGRMLFKTGGQGSSCLSVRFEQRHEGGEGAMSVPGDKSQAEETVSANLEGNLIDLRPVWLEKRGPGRRWEMRAACVGWATRRTLVTLHPRPSEMEPRAGSGQGGT